ncbi:ATP-binding protein [Desulfobacterales bacterium HSG2]|nr:ATP-binding protein [Desulfobacterales bacterium HSG2]
MESQQTIKSKILIVDDKEENLYALRDVLREADAEIITATSSIEGLKATLNHEFALIILDVQMPEMDGYELAEAIRSQKQTEKVPITFMSAVYSTDYYVFKGYQSGAVDFIVNPVDPQVIVNKVKVFVDLDQQKRELAASLEKQQSLNDRLAETVAELKRSNKELEQFAYVASHDLQEPLRMVISYVNLLERRYKGKLDADADDFIGFATDGALRMRTLINDLLEFSRVGTRREPLKAVKTEDVLTQTLSDLRLTVRESGAEVTRDTLPTVMADSSQLKQLFQNLISNAIKFRGEAPPRVHMTAEEKNGEWVFSVRDNGIGIAAEYHDQIFVIFKRLHGRTDYPGNGIGLAVCKKIVERHGGRIWMESREGVGTTFYFTIPLSKEIRQSE